MKNAAQLRADARKMLQGNYWMIFVAILIVDAIVGAAASTAVGAFIVAGPFSVGLCAFMLRVSRNGNNDLMDIFSGFKANFGANCVAGILVSIYTFLWSLLFFIPGIIKSYAYKMTYYILQDNPGMSAQDAIKASEEMMRGKKWKLFCLELSFIGWVLLSMLTFGIGLIFLAPYMQAAEVAFYEEAKGTVTK